MRIALGLLTLAATLAFAHPLRAQEDVEADDAQPKPPVPPNRGVYLKPQAGMPSEDEDLPRRRVKPIPSKKPPAGPPYTNTIAPKMPAAAAAPGATRATEPPATPPVEKKDIHTNAKTVVMSFDKRDLAEVIQFVSQFTQRNFILPERISGKITILSNAPIPADEVWSVFLAALDANNWAVYPVGSYWKVTEKKQASRAVIPTYLDGGQEAPPAELMVIAGDKSFQAILDLMRQLDIPTGDGAVHVHYLENAKAEDVASTLQSL